MVHISNSGITVRERYREWWMNATAYKFRALASVGEKQFLVRFKIVANKYWRLPNENSESGGSEITEGYTKSVMKGRSITGFPIFERIHVVEIHNNRVRSSGATVDDF